MVASARERKSAAEQQSRQQQKELAPHATHTRDGRRHIFGLSQAIREKAFQSTSPSSEAKLKGQAVHASRPIAVDHRHNMELSQQQKKTGNDLTIEERLRNLLNSDTEGPDEKSMFQCPRRYRSKTPGPYNQDYVRPLRQPSSGPAATSSPGQQPLLNGDRLVQKNARGEYVLVNRTQTNTTLNVTRNNSSPLQQMNRCASAIPPNFKQDENWNKVQEPPKYQDIAQRVRTTTTSAENTRKNDSYPSPDTPTGQRLQQSPGRENVREATGRMTQAAPPLRRSLCFQSENTEPRMALDTKSQGLNIRLVAPAYQHTCAKAVNHHQPSSTSYSQRNDYVTRKTINMAWHSPDKDANDTNRVPVNHSLTHKPPMTKPNVPSDIINNHVTNQSDHYPQQNFSFRRAVHHTVSSDSLHSSKPPKGDTRRSPSTKPSQGDDREIRKSEDRDSGTVLEPEASVFDFDSSILSEEANGSRSSPSPNKSSQRKEVWSRSSTPILPPLSFPEDDDDHGEIQEEKVKETILLVAKDWDEPNMQAPKHSLHLRRSKSDSKEKQSQSVNIITNSNTGVAAELSPTESALSEVKAKSVMQKLHTKVISSKIQRGASSFRRGSYPKNLSGDERFRVKKHRQRRCYDDSEPTDWSQQDGFTEKAHHQELYYVGNPGVAIDPSELGETSSVRSVTTTSVCSGALRKSGRKRRSFLAGGGGERYAREIRSVNKRFTRLEAHVVTLARSLAQLSSELRHQSATSREIDQIRQQVQEIRSHQITANEQRKNPPQIILKSEGGKQPKLSKLAKFFCEQPPLLHLFLKQLGYEFDSPKVGVWLPLSLHEEAEMTVVRCLLEAEKGSLLLFLIISKSVEMCWELREIPNLNRTNTKYIKNFEAERIGMMELPYMDERRLCDIGIPLGPRLRILKEAQKSSYV